MAGADADAWRRFAVGLLRAALLLGGGLWLFIALVDPFGTLPTGLPLDRGPAANNARYAFPMLARSADFDSAILGTSTSRMLRPEVLNPAFGARFANLSMNDATAWEQARLGLVFLRTPVPRKWLLVGIDSVWCEPPERFRRTTPRAFPEFMYDDDPWNDLREIFSLYFVEQAGLQLVESLGLKPRGYGRDGYTSFLPDDSRWDAARVLPALMPPAPETLAPIEAHDTPDVAMPGIDLLAELLAARPPGMRTLLFFAPLYVGADRQPEPSHPEHARIAACKARITALARAAGNVIVADFMRPTALTRDPANYWDPLHYRIGPAGDFARALGDAAAGRDNPLFVVLR